MLKRLVAQRRLIGWMATVALIGGIACWPFSSLSVTGGSLGRVGVVLATLWLAIPAQVDESRPPISLWKVVSGIMLMIAVVRNPWILVPMGFAMAILSLFRQRSR